MKIGLWNIDHPEKGSGSPKREDRFEKIRDFLMETDFEVFILTEANAAIEMPGYFTELSEESPFRNSRRFYGEPNRYHQVAIYSKTPLERLKATEPVNGLLCKTLIGDHPLVFYGNVITIKDRWSHSSMKTFSDRLEEQLLAIESLSRKRTLIGGDFNLRVGWHSGAHRAIKERLAAEGWLWPTEERNDTVQQVLHSPDLQVHTNINFDVRERNAGILRAFRIIPF